MISQEEVCNWFKNLEGYSRIELMCALLDSCLPLELRFLGTYLEYSAGKHYTHLQKWEKDANKSSLWLNGDKDRFSNKTFRRKFCIFLALLHSHNRSIAVKLFEVLNQWEHISTNNDKEDTILEQSCSKDPSKKNCKIESSAEKISFYNEMRLLFSMASLHPALDFAQKANLRDKKEKFSTDCKITLSSETRGTKTDIKKTTSKENHLNSNISETEIKVVEKDEYHSDKFKTESLKSSINTTLPPTAITIAGSVSPQISSMETNSTFAMQVTEPEGTTVPLVSRTTALPATVPNIPHLPLMDTVYQMPPYRTAPMLLPRSQIAGAGIHRPIEQQIPIHVNIPLQPVQCVVNNQQYIQNNISVHANNTPISTSNLFTSSENVNEVGVPNNQNLHKNNLIQTTISMVSSNIYTPRTIDSLSGLNFIPMGNRKQFTGPPLGRFSKLVNVGNDDSSLPSHVYSVSILKDSSTSLSTITTIPTHSINRRCLSESDAHDKMNGTREPLQNLINQKPIPVTYATQMFNVDQKKDSHSQKLQYYSHIPTGFGSNPVYLSKYHTTSQNFQTLPNNNNVNITENNVPNHVIFTYDSQQIQSKQPVRTQQQPSSPSRIIPNNPMLSTLIPQSPMLPVSTEEDKPALILNQQQPILSPMKTIPTGINGTYISAQAFGSRPPNVFNELHKYDSNLGKPEYVTNIPATKSLPIPVQRRPHSLGGKFPPDIIESSCSSPSQSPKLSPSCSPAQSPLSRRKENHDVYSSTNNWLKSIRLHKYSDMLENCSFEKLKEMKEEDFKRIGLTVGASNKIKQQIDHLASRGLKEFGNPENLTNPDLPQSGGGSSNVSPASISPVGTKYLSAGVLQQDSSQVFNASVNDENEKEENQIPESSSLQQNEVIVVDSDDEVFPTRKRSEHQATCYNCGHVGHYGDECTEQTMESLTYIRYSFQLDYSRNTPDITTSDGIPSTTTTSDAINR